MSLIAGLTGAKAAGMAGEAASTWWNNRQATKRQREAQDFSAQQYATRYQTQVKDLKAAGLNPMLAYHQSPGSAPSGVAISGGSADFAGASQREASTAADYNLKSQQEKVAKEEAQNLRVVWHKLDMEVEKTGREIKEIDQRIKTGKATEQETILRQELTKRQTQLTEYQMQLARQQYNIATPTEQAANTWSATAAAQGKNIADALKPLIDAIGGAVKARPK